METGIAPSGTLSTWRTWMRVCRPLFLWLAVFLGVLAWNYHKYLLLRTTLVANVKYDGPDGPWTTEVTLDGQRYKFGLMVPLGRHDLVVKHPKNETFQTNLFVWYGGKNLGTIELKRSKGILNVSGKPAAKFISIRGPDFNLTLTNSTGFSNAIPTDDYSVEAYYKHWQKRDQAKVAANSPTSIMISPKFASLQLTCNQTDATYRLLDASDVIVESGTLPATIVDLPVGKFKLTAFHREHHWGGSAEVTEDGTNSVQIEFTYGAATIETQPPGASVIAQDGKQLGSTPLSLDALEPGQLAFTLQLNGYLPVKTSLAIIAHEISSFRTNLVSEAYANAIQAARQHLMTADYEPAVQSATEALRLQPNDDRATALLNEATALINLRNAESFGNNGDYERGISSLKLALSARPENEKAKRMLAEFEKNRKDQLDRARSERLALPRKVFESVVDKTVNAGLFKTHELSGPKPVKEVESSIVSSLQSIPDCRILSHRFTSPEVFIIEAVQEFSTFLKTSAGRRFFLIVGGQTKDDETQVFFKVLEFRAEAVNKVSIGNLIGTPVEVKQVPIELDPKSASYETYKARILEGVSNLTWRVEASLRP